MHADHFRSLDRHDLTRMASPYQNWGPMGSKTAASMIASGSSTTWVETVQASEKEWKNERKNEEEDGMRENEEDNRKRKREDLAPGAGQMPIIKFCKRVE